MLTLFGGALLEVGELDRAIHVLREGSQRFPRHASLAAALARALAGHGDVDGALAVAANWPEESWAARFSLRLLTKHRRFDEAACHEDRVQAANPADLALIECRALRLRAEPEAMLGLCETALAHDAGATHALYYKAIALAQLGRDEEARELMALDRFVCIVDLPPPSGYPDADAFRAAVRHEIVANPTLGPDIAGHATRNGMRTARFPLAGDAASSALVRSIEGAVVGYAEALRGSHPFVTARPPRARLFAWALVFREAGYQVPHHHPEPWMTGVYYVAAPAGQPRPGALRIGVFPDWAGVAPPWPVQVVEPEPGRLVLFPSFVPHDTVPTGSAGERVSIAFDVGAAT